MATVEKNLSGKSPEETQVFISSLVKEQGLRELKIYYAKLLDEGCVTNICDIILKNSALTVLELRGCGLSNEDVRRICEALVATAHTKSLKRLVLASNQITDKGISSICDFITSSTSLSFLDLSDNQITYGIFGAPPWQPGMITTLESLNNHPLQCVLFHANNLSKGQYQQACSQFLDLNICTSEEDLVFQPLGATAAAGSAMGGAPAIADSTSIVSIDVIPNDEADLDDDALLETFCCNTVPELKDRLKTSLSEATLAAVFKDLRKRKGDDPEDPPPHRSRGTD